MCRASILSSFPGEAVATCSMYARSLTLFPSQNKNLSCIKTTDMAVTTMQNVISDQDQLFELPSFAMRYMSEIITEV